LLHRLYNSAIINSWFSGLIMLFSSLIAIPIVLSKLSVEEINVWFLFASIVAISHGVLFGFNSTFARFVAYANSGVKISEFRNLRFKKESTFSDYVDNSELGRIFFLMKKVYLFLSLIYAFIIIAIGYFALSKPIAALDIQAEGWLAGLIVAVSTIMTLSFGYYQVFLLGINKVALVQRIMSVVNLVGLFFILIVLFIYPTLISIVLVYQLVALSTTFSIIYYSRRELKNNNISNRNKKFDRELFTIVWESAWKSGITTILSNVVQHISAIIVAHFFVPAVSASFLFTKRLFDILARFTMTTFQARLPIIAKYRGRGDFDTLIPFLRQTQYISFSVLLIGYAILLFFGEGILSLIKSNVNIGDFTLLMLFSFATFLSRWGGMNLSISNQANHVVEHINALIGATIYLITIYLFFNFLGVNIFPFANIISFFFVLYLFIKNVYPTIHTTFISYEKKVMFPAISILAFTNVAYYLLNK